MKKQINPNIKAHLMRGAFYLLLLVTVCAIPFALAQRNARPSRSGAKMIVPKRPGLTIGHASLPNAGGPSAGADAILNHLSHSVPQATGQARTIVPKVPGGIDCDNAPGIVIHDDGGIENGYSGSFGIVTEVRFVDKFTPSSYPASYTSVCLDFVVLPGGPATYPVDVVVYDDDGPGGSPGTLLGELDRKSTR